MWFLIACMGGGGPLGGSSDSGSADSGGGLDLGPCGGFWSFGDLGAEWDYRYTDAIDYDGSWTTTVTSVDGGEYVHRTVGEALPPNRDDYSWVAEWTYRCDDEGVWQTSGWQETTDVFDGETHFSSYEYVYTTDVHMWPRDPSVGDSWFRRQSYQVYDRETGDEVGLPQVYLTEETVAEVIEHTVPAGTFQALRVDSVSDGGSSEYYLASGPGLLGYPTVSELVDFRE